MAPRTFLTAHSQSWERGQVWGGEHMHIGIKRSLEEDGVTGVQWGGLGVGKD